MIIALCVFFIAALLGLPFVWPGSPARSYAAPAIGMAGLIFLSYLLSTNLKISGADAVAISLPLMAIISAATLVVRIRQRAPGLGNCSNWIDFACVLLPVFVLLLPATQYFLANFFGAVNFDFFYNSQDSFYLSSHNYLQFAPSADDSILPLKWSANYQGRFAISLLGAFALKYLSLDPLHFNACLLSALLLVFSSSIFSFAVGVLQLSRIYARVAVTAAVLSAGFSQGYIYFLLGQASALPLFVVSLIYLFELLNTLSTSGFNRRQLVIAAFPLIVLLNVLYVFYAILSFFLIAIIIVATLFHSYYTGNRFGSELSGMIKVLVGAIGLFLVVRLFSLGASFRVLAEWVTLSLRTASTHPTAPRVFSEYNTESFLALLFGAVRYPSVASIYNSFLGFGFAKSWILLGIGITCLSAFLSLLRLFVTECKKHPAKVAVGMSLVVITFALALVFFITQSSYGVFKLGCWFIPILLTLTVASLAASSLQSGLARVVAYFSAVLLLVGNILTAINYVYPFSQWMQLERYENSLGVNGMIGVGDLKTWVNKYPNRPLVFDMSDGIKMAWLANEFRNRDVSALSHGWQPLADVVVPGQPCSTLSYPALPQNGFVVAGSGSDDILSLTPKVPPSYSSHEFRVFDVYAIDHLAFLGRGTYPAYTLATGDPALAHFPKTFRWIEKGFELYTYSRVGGKVSLRFTAAPGYVSGPPARTLEVNLPDGRRDRFTMKDLSVFEIAPFSVGPGLSCIYISSPDSIVQSARYGALIRNNIPNDSRVLNFAVGNMSVNFSKG